MGFARTPYILGGLFTKNTNIKKNTRINNALFLTPALLLFVLFVVVPFFEGIPVAFSNWDGISQGRGSFVGFKNFADVFGGKDVRNATRNTVIYTLITVTGSNILGILLANGVQRKTKLNNLLRGIYFMPFVISLLLGAYVWRYLYSGVIYKVFGISSPLGNTKYALIAIAIIAIWRDSGYTMVVYIAGLNMIPSDLYEAAMVEGAGPVKRFFTISLPLLMPSISANVVLTLAWGLKQFDLVMAATGGGPGKATQTLAMVIYKNIFEYQHAGYGQAMAIIFTIFMATISSTVSGILRRREVEI